MGGRQILGAAFVVLGIVSAVAGLIGVLGDDAGEVTAEPAPVGTTPDTPTPSIEPSESPTNEPSESPSIEPSESPAAEPAEAPEVFFTALAAAFRENDVRFLFSRLHPFALERYGAGQCRAYFSSLDLPAYELEVLSVGDVGSFVYETDGVRRRVQGATTVRIRFTEDGTTFIETDSHVVLEGDRFLWFTDCGTPKAGAA